jgi:hypothetical protein
MRLIITQGNDLIADIPDYQGPVPPRGEYIHRPSLGDTEPRPGLHDGFMSVQSVQYGIIARPQNGEGHFVGAAEPFVEVIV